MAECPGVLHLAEMADGALARVRAPGGRLGVAQTRAVARAAATLGSGAIDLTNRANLQIRGMAAEAGRALAAQLSTVDLFVDGPADRRRNILIDPFSGLDPWETRDMRPLASALDEGLRASGWIGRLSPKFSFVLDGGGRAGVAAIASDVVCRAGRDGGTTIGVGNLLVEAADDRACLSLLLAAAEAAASAGPDARASALDPAALAALASIAGVRSAAEAPAARQLRPVFGITPQRVRDDRVSLSIPVPVGRLDADMLDWLAELAERHGEGWLALAPWSAVVIGGMPAPAAELKLAESVTRGFTPIGVAERLLVVACAGSTGCARGREPAKELAREILALAAAEPERLPPEPTRVHLSACPKGCAGGAMSDLLLLGAQDQQGWSAHSGGSPRAPGEAIRRLGEASARDVFELLAARDR